MPMGNLTELSTLRNFNHFNSLNSNIINASMYGSYSAVTEQLILSSTYHTIVELWMGTKW